MCCRKWPKKKRRLKHFSLGRHPPTPCKELKVYCSADCRHNYPADYQTADYQGNDPADYHVVDYHDHYPAQ